MTYFFFVHIKFIIGLWKKTHIFLLHFKDDMGKKESCFLKLGVNSGTRERFIEQRIPIMLYTIILSFWTNKYRKIKHNKLI